jgi:hypothetical protein
MPTEYEKFYNEKCTDRLKDILRRDDGIKRFGFAVLTEGAITLLRPHAPYIEVGAGSGYWAYEMEKRDVEVVATDPKKLEDNTYEFAKQWTKVKRMTGTQAVKKYLEHTLLMVWPCYNKPWAYNTLKAYKGNKFVYCGEGSWGCNANDAFHKLLLDEWEQRISIYLPQWSGIHDYLDVYVRKSCLKET